MTQRKEPYTDKFNCSVVGKSVDLRGVKVYLHGGPSPLPLNVAFRPTSCTGMPACGRIVGDLRCPAPKSA
jgi:hypothetical protein